MEKRVIPKPPAVLLQIDEVTLWRRAKSIQGSLDLTQHHLIFKFLQPETDITQKPKPREQWITYPMIQHCTYRPTPPLSQKSPSIRLRCRDFSFVSLHFLNEIKARDVYDMILNLTCKLGKLEKLYAFTYVPQGPEREIDGWKIYDPMKEFGRLGVGGKGTNLGWRISTINIDYQYSPTYPALIGVPFSISDNVINYGGKYRSRVRIPALTYLHPVNNCSITRAAQPLVGIRGTRSRQDEKLVEAIFLTSNPRTTPSGLSTVEGLSLHENSESKSEPQGLNRQSSSNDIEVMKAEGATSENIDIIQSTTDAKQSMKVYGAQQKNLIIDARPTVNAYVMQAAGYGSENMENYPFAAKAYLGIDNIHVMRDSLNKVVDALKDSDVAPFPPNREQLAKSGWLKHISNMLDGSSLIARQVGIHHSHVLIHCSDGWDRTSQLSALSQLCLDPYYRTMEGFIVLVEKDWLSFGHMFRHRAGLLNSEKWFDIENERVAPNRNNGTESPFSGNKSVNEAFGSALKSAKGFFNKHNNDSRESLVDQESELQPFEGSPNGRISAPTVKPSKDDKYATKPKETSPVFHQFLDATYQLLYQHPKRFEFNERFLRRLLYQLYACQYGTFLHNSEKERVDGGARERTRSVWDYFLARREEFINVNYDPTINDNSRGQERLLFPDCKQIRWWAEAFGRADEDMNVPGVLESSHEPVSNVTLAMEPLFESDTVVQVETRSANAESQAALSE